MLSFDEAANLIGSRMGITICPNHIAPGSGIAVITTPNGPGLMPDCCCSELAFLTFYAFDKAWNSLPEVDRPMKSGKVFFSLLDTEGSSIEDQAVNRIEWLEEIREELGKFAYCEEHPQNTYTVEIEHNDEGASVFMVHGCCPRFEEAAHFFMAIHVRPSIEE